MMKNLLQKLIIYRNFSSDIPLYKIANIFIQYNDKTIDKDTAIGLIYNEIYRIIDIGIKSKFSDNLWLSYIAYLLATSENPFTLSIERTGIIDDTLKSFALNDCDIFIKLINFEFSSIERELGIDCFTMIKKYTTKNKNETPYDHNLSILINELSNEIKDIKDTNALYEKLIEFYKKYGVGDFGLYKAFRLSPLKDGKLFIPISVTSNIKFTDLLGYDEQKQELVNNTEAFLNNQHANNVLLYGDAGTGKSSSIKSLLNMYYERGLRMIEVYKQDYQYLPEIMSILKNRNYHFILYFDDLSFEKNETEYKYLKAIIEGGLEVKPDNVLIYATSNRTHLLHETFSDRKEVETDDVHITDTLTEQTSLSLRFGLTIGYFCPKRQDFLDMIVELASRHKELSHMDKNELIEKAIYWNRYHPDMSGRSAQQFVDYLMTQM